MDNFNFYSPTEFVFGKDRESECGEYVKKYGGSKVLIHYGGGSAERSGLLGRVRESLNKSGISFVELGGVKPNPRDTLVYKGIDLCRSEGVDFILAVGGGSSIDSAKAICLLQTNEGSIVDYLFGGTKTVTNPIMPLICIPTTAGTGAEMTAASVITNNADKTKTPVDKL